MSEKPPQDVQQELSYQARQAELLGAVRPTPEATLRRYREHPHWKIYNKEYVFSAIARQAPQTICDFGCGAGETSTELAWCGYHVTGFDLSPELIALARRRAELDQVTGNAEFLIANAHETNLKKQGFDLVLAQGVLHHIDIHEGVAELHDLLKPGGVAVIQEPVAFSSGLQKLRDLTPVPKDISPNERQLNLRDIAVVESRFLVLEKRYFHLFSRLQRLVPGALREGVLHLLCWLDYWVIRLVPGAWKFAGIIVLVCRKRPQAPAAPRSENFPQQGCHRAA